MAYKQLKLWFDEELAASLADKILSIESTFSKKEFIGKVNENINKLELKDRIETFADVLFDLLPGNYEKKIDILLQILGPENEQETGMFKEYFWIMPIAKMVEKYGLEDFDISIHAIKEITKRNTGEYTIRPFITRYETKTLAVLINWAQAENKHLRRLASEGIRIRLPWAKKFHQFSSDPSPIFEIIEMLKDDESKYVQKSVANSLNDVLKENYSAAIELINKWAKNPTKQRKWIIKHALRNQIKVGNQEAISIIKSF